VNATSPAPAGVFPPSPQPGFTWYYDQPVPYQLTALALTVPGTGEGGAR
jgi:hypothetical protein